MKLQLILENKRDQYLIRVLEEGTTELESLKTKQYLNENLNIIEKVLVEEGVIDNVKNHLSNNWGKYAAGVGALAAGAGTAAYGAEHPDQVHQVVDKAKEIGHNAIDKVKNAFEDNKDKMDTPTSDENYVKSLNIKTPEDLQHRIDTKAIDPNNPEVMKLRKSLEAASTASK